MDPMSNGTGQQAVQNMVPLATTLVIIYALLGAALVILSAIADVNENFSLTFKEYIEQMVIAIGGLSIGRGLLAQAKAVAGGT
jgi:hypothetical protein